MKKIFSLMTIAAGLLALAGCKEDLDPQSGSAAPYSGINFSMTSDSPNTRTQYASNDWLQIEWIEGDEITIACDQTQYPTDGNAANLALTNWAKKTSAIYKVNQVIADKHSVTLSNNTTQEITTNSKARIQPSSTDAKEALYWGKNEVDHVFYAGYGEGITINEVTGVAKCVYQPDQFLTENTARNEWINMEQAYMVAKKVTKPVDNVDLHFKPIMTTLAVEVQAPTGGLTVKAMEIDLPASLDVIYTNSTTNSAYFDYDIANGTVKTTNVGTQTADKLVFNLNTPKTLAASEKTTLVALLPPVAIKSGDQITITIDANEGYSVTKVTTLAVPAGNKAVISASADWKKKAISEVESIDYVDMGPAGKWATRNLGASSPEEYGDYYGWGCTEPYASSANVDWPLYFKKIGGTGTTQFDCGTDKDPLKDVVNIAGTKYDAAHVKLGENWRMPTRKEFEVLLGSDFTWTPTTLSGVQGYEVKYNTNGNTIFLPFAGNRECFTLYDAGDACYYWISNPATTVNSYIMNGTSSTHQRATLTRYAGVPIRPVYDDKFVALAGHLWAKENVSASGSSGAITPVATDATYGDYFTQDGSTGTSAKDAAEWNSGGRWTLPTKTQWQDLIDKCDWEWKSGYSYNGKTVNGRLVKGKGIEVGNSIFLPAAGYADVVYSHSRVNLSTYGDFWSSDYNWSIYFGSSDSGVINEHSVSDGMGVRPVIKE